MSNNLPDSDGKANTGYHHGDLRAALVAEARRIVERDGPESVSLRAIAKAAGVSRAAPYHHFKDKRALLAAVAATGFRELAAHMNAKLDPAAAPRDRLDQLGFGYVEFGLRHAALCRLMQGPDFQKAGEYPDLDAAREESATPLTQTVSACLPGASQSAIRQACAAAWSIVHGLAQLATDGRIESLIGIADLSAATKSVTSALDLGVYR